MARFYQFPYNYESGSITSTATVGGARWERNMPAPNLSDGRPETYVDTDNGEQGKRYLFEFPESRRINTIFLVTSALPAPSPGTGLTTFDFAGEGSGTNVPPQTFLTAPTEYTPGTVMTPTPNLANLKFFSGTRQRLNNDDPPSGVFVANKRYTQYTLASNNFINASRVRLTFTGDGLVYNVIFTELLATLTESEHWTEISHRRIMEGSARRRNIRGDSITIPGRGGRWKWRTDYTGYFGNLEGTIRDDDDTSVDRRVLQTPSGNVTTVEEFSYIIETNPNFFFYPTPMQNPRVFYPATVSPSDMQIDYVGRLLTQRQIRFTIQEL